MTIEEQAWLLYCEDTAGDMDVRDYWEQLPERVQKIYLTKAQNNNKKVPHDGINPDGH